MNGHDSMEDIEPIVDTEWVRELERTECHLGEQVCTSCLTAHHVLSNDCAYQTRYLKNLIHHYDKIYPLYCSSQEKVIEESENRAELMANQAELAEKRVELAEKRVELANNRAEDAETQTGVLQARLLMMGVVSVSLLVGMVFIKRTH